MSSNNIWTNLPVEGLDSSDEDSPTPNASDSHQAATTTNLNSTEIERDDSSFTAVPARARLTPEQQARNAAKNEHLKQALIAAGTPKVSHQGRNSYREREARRTFDNKAQQNKAASNKAKKDQDRADKEANDAANAEWRKHADSNYRPEATLESFIKGNQRRRRN